MNLQKLHELSDKVKEFTQKPKFRTILFYVLLGLGLLCFVLAIVTSVPYTQTEENTETKPTVINVIRQDIEAPDKEVIVDTPLEKYEDLIADIENHVETDNILMIYTSVSLDEEYSQILTLESGVQGKNRLFSISTNDLSFTLYYIDDVNYLVLADDKNAKLYRIDTEGDYVERVSNTTKGLIESLQGLDYTNFEYAGTALVGDKDFLKLVVQNKGSDENRQKDGIEGILAIRPSIEVFETELEIEDIESVEETKKTEKTDNEKSTELMSGLTNITNFNVLTMPGKCIFYFDKNTNTLKKLYIRNTDSISTINIVDLIAISLPANVSTDKALIISEDKVGRLMLSSVFAMVSDTELNELKIRVE